MISVTELRNGTVFETDGQLWQVVSYEHIKMGRGSANIKVKVRSIKTGTTTEKSFISGARVQDAMVEKRQAQYLYRDKDMFVFMENTTFSQVELPEAVLGQQVKFLTDGMDITVLFHGDQAVAVELPRHITFTVSETGPGVRGDSVSNVYKSATLENGMEIQVPMFVKSGDKVKVDTKTGQYVERVTK